jgi:hypothetical protein
MNSAQGTVLSVVGDPVDEIEDNGFPRMEIGKWYWAKTVSDLHRPTKAHGPFHSQEAAIHAAAHHFQEVFQLKLPGVYYPDSFYTGQAAHLSLSLPDLAEEFIDGVREETLIPEEVDPELACEDGWSIWLFDISPRLVEQLNEMFRDSFQKWLLQNHQEPPLYGVDHLKHHVL